MPKTFGGMIENLYQQKKENPKPHDLSKPGAPLSLEETQAVMGKVYEHLSEVKESFPNLQVGVPAIRLFFEEKGIVGPDVDRALDQIEALEIRREKAQFKIKFDYYKSAEFLKTNMELKKDIDKLSVSITDRDTMNHVFLNAIQNNPNHARELKHVHMQYVLKYKDRVQVHPQDARDIAILINHPVLLDAIMRSDTSFRLEESKIFNQVYDAHRAPDNETEPK